MAIPTNGIVWVFNEQSLVDALQDYVKDHPDAEARRAVILEFLNSESADRLGLRRMALPSGS